MNNHKNINYMLESWGRSKREAPPNNDILKREILSRVSASSSGREPVFKHSIFRFAPLAFTAMAAIVLLVSSGSDYVSKGTMIQSDSPASYPTDAVETGAYNKSIAPQYQYPESSLSDKREFLKIGYNASLRTRHISDAKARVESLVHGFGGRVDSSSLGDKSGYVSFAVPKDKLEAFRAEVKDLVGSRFYEEYMDSQNLLPYKQVIEESQKQWENSLSDLKAERAVIVKNHTQNVSAYQNRINPLNAEINALSIEYPYANSQRQAQITARIAQLQGEISTLNSQIAGENKNYQAKIGNIDMQIKNGEENLKAIKTQDKNLTDSVATVNGSVSLRSISLWEFADAYLWGPILSWILLLGAIASYLWYRRFARGYEV